jgi:hypothetical protein
MATRKAEPLVATTSFATEVKGVEVLVHAGDVVPASSPLVKGRKELFVTEAEYRQTEGTPPAPAA